MKTGYTFHIKRLLRRHLPRPLLSGGDGGGFFLFGTSFCVSPNSLLRKEKLRFCFPFGLHCFCTV